MTVCIYRLRLAKLNEQMKEDSDMGRTDDTFQEVFREFSNMASNNPELLRRNIIPIDPIEEKSEESTKLEQSTKPEQSKQSTDKQSTTPEQSKQSTDKQSTTPEQSKQSTDGQSTNITEQNPT